MAPAAFCDSTTTNIAPATMSAGRLLSSAARTAGQPARLNISRSDSRCSNSSTYTRKSGAKITAGVLASAPSTMGSR